MSLGSASAFALAGVLTTLVVLFINVKYPGDRKVTALFYVLCLSEGLDSIPEALLLGQAGVAGDFKWALVVSLFFFTSINTVIACLDFCTNESPKLNVTFYGLLTFSLGCLVYSLSADIYSDFEEHWNLHEKSIVDLILLFAGTALGGLAISAITIIVHKKLEADKKKHLENINDEPTQHQVDPDEHDAPETRTLLRKKKPNNFRNCCVSIILWLALAIFQAGSTALVAFVFWSIQTSEHSIYSLFEGFSGGCFLGTISGTVIPAIQEQRSFSGLGNVAAVIVGTTLLIAGILVATLVDVIT